jgi:hypothetical protein
MNYPPTGESSSSSATGGFSIFESFAFDLYTLQAFIASQLDTWRLTRIFNEGVVYSYLLRYTFESLPVNLSEQGLSALVPLVFEAATSKLHIFALSHHKMTRHHKVYSIKELLGFRDNQVCDGMKAMAANPEIGMYHHPNLARDLNLMICLLSRHCPYPRGCMQADRDEVDIQEERLVSLV